MNDDEKNLLKLSFYNSIDTLCWASLGEIEIPPQRIGTFNHPNEEVKVYDHNCTKYTSI